MLTAAAGDTILLAFNMAWAGKHVYTRMQPFFRQKKNMKIFRSFIIEVEIVQLFQGDIPNYIFLFKSKNQTSLISLT